MVLKNTRDAAPHPDAVRVDPFNTEAGPKGPDTAVEAPKVPAEGLPKPVLQELQALYSSIHSNEAAIKGQLNDFAIFADSPTTNAEDIDSTKKQLEVTQQQLVAFIAQYQRSDLKAIGKLPESAEIHTLYKEILILLNQARVIQDKLNALSAKSTAPVAAPVTPVAARPAAPVAAPPAIPPVKPSRPATPTPTPTTPRPAAPLTAPAAPRVVPPRESLPVDPAAPKAPVFTSETVEKAKARFDAVKGLTEALIAKADEQIDGEKERFPWFPRLEDWSRSLNELKIGPAAWHDQEKGNMLTRFLGRNANGRTLARLGLVGGVGMFGGAILGGGTLAVASAKIAAAGLSAAISFGTGYYDRKRASRDAERQRLENEIQNPEAFPDPVHSATMLAKKIYSAILAGKAEREIDEIIAADSSNLITEELPDDKVMDPDAVEARKMAILRLVSKELDGVNIRLRSAEKKDAKNAMGMTIAAMVLGKVVKLWLVDGINPLEEIRHSLASGSELMNRSVSAVSEWWNTPAAESIPTSEPSAAPVAEPAPAAPQVATPGPQEGIPVTPGAKEALAAQSHAQDLKDGRFTTPYDRMSPAEKAHYDDVRSGRVAGTVSPDALKPTVPPAPTPEAPKVDVAAAVAATPDTSAGGFAPSQDEFNKYVIGKVDINDAGVTKDQVNNGFSYIFKHQLMDHAEEYGFDGKGSKEAWAMRRLMEIMKEVKIDGKSVYDAQQLWATDEAVGKAYILDMDAHGKFSVDIYQKTDAGWASYDGNGADVKVMPLENAHGGHAAGHTGGASAHPEGTGTHAAAHAEPTVPQAPTSIIDDNGNRIVNGVAQSPEVVTPQTSREWLRDWADKRGYKGLFPESKYLSWLDGQIGKQSGTVWSYSDNPNMNDSRALEVLMNSGVGQFESSHELPIQMGQSGARGVIEFTSNFKGIEGTSGSIPESAYDKFFNLDKLNELSSKQTKLVEEFLRLKQGQGVLGKMSGVNTDIHQNASGAISRRIGALVKMLGREEGLFKADIRPKN